MAGCRTVGGWFISKQPPSRTVFAPAPELPLTAPSPEVTRARIEHQTALVEYQRAKLDLAGKACGVVIAALALATAVVGGVTAIILALAV